jgi:hypothetical protein
MIEKTSLKFIEWLTPECTKRMKLCIDRITKLTEEWYRLIGSDHHKDRDCHFYIETKWSYGDPPKYSVLHNGYILHDFDGEEYETYEEALDGLISFLSKAIDDEKVHQTTVEDF